MARAVGRIIYLYNHPLKTYILGISNVRTPPCADIPVHAQDQLSVQGHRGDQTRDPNPAVQPDAGAAQHRLQQLPPIHEDQEEAPASPSLYVEYQSGGRANVANDLVVYETLIEDDGAPHFHQQFQGRPFPPGSQGQAYQSDAAIGGAAGSPGSIQGWALPAAALWQPPSAPLDPDPTQDPALDPTQDPEPIMPVEESLASPSYSPPPESADPDLPQRALGAASAAVESGRRGVLLLSEEGLSALQQHCPPLPRLPPHPPLPPLQQQHWLPLPQLQRPPQQQVPPPPPQQQQLSGGGATTFSSMDDSERDYAAVDLAEAALRSRSNAAPGAATSAAAAAAAAPTSAAAWTAAPGAPMPPPINGAAAAGHWGPGSAAAPQAVPPALLQLQPPAPLPQLAPPAPLPRPPPAQGAGVFEYFPSLPTQVGNSSPLQTCRRCRESAFMFNFICSFL